MLKISRPRSQSPPPIKNAEDTTWQHQNTEPAWKQIGSLEDRSRRVNLRINYLKEREERETHRPTRSRWKSTAVHRIEPPWLLPPRIMTEKSRLHRSGQATLFSSHRTTVTVLPGQDVPATQSWTRLVVWVSKCSCSPAVIKLLHSSVQHLFNNLSKAETFVLCRDTSPLFLGVGYGVGNKRRLGDMVGVNVGSDHGFFYTFMTSITLLSWNGWGINIPQKQISILDILQRKK